VFNTLISEFGTLSLWTFPWPH